MKLNVDIKTVQKINEVDGTFQVQYILSLSWYDSRLSFKNLKAELNSNTLNLNEKESVWIPKIIFANTDKV